MNTVFIYKSAGDFFLNETKLSWGTDRELVRTTLENKHTVSDIVVDLKAGADPGSILYKRDAYEDFPSFGDFYFLSYDDKDALREIEIHSGINIEIENFKLTFNAPFSGIVSTLKNISTDYIELSEGEWLFKDLKIIIADSMSMGDEPGRLSYFYCTDNIGHLI